jgi:K+/H+ antiporter YhaU regulatory subunit KhtT
MLFNPGHNEVLRDGDAMIVLGRDDQVTKLREIAYDFES